MLHSQRFQNGAFQNDNRKNSPRSEDGRTLATLSKMMNLIDNEEAQRHISPRKAETLRTEVLALSKNYKEFNRSSLTQHNAVTAKSRMIRILWFLVAVSFAAAGLLAMYILDLSPVVAESIVYLVSTIFIIALKGIYFNFFGGLIFSITFGYSCSIRVDERHAAAVISSVLAVFWSTLTLMHQSSLFGFMAVSFMEALLGFSILPDLFPGDFDPFKMARIWTIGSFCLMFVGAVNPILRSKNVKISFMIRILEPFALSMLLLGPVIGFIGLLITGSFPREIDSKFEYYAANVAYVVMVAICVWLGTEFGVPTVREVACCCSYFWILTKWCEVSLDSWGWVGGLAGTAVVFAAMAKSYEANSFLGLFPLFQTKAKVHASQTD